jgi:hypothetical protein
VVAVDGGTLRAPSPGVTAESLRARMTPPRTALPLDELLAVLRSGPLAPWWSPAVEAAVLPIFGLGDDGLVPARLPFEAHMAIVDDLIAADLEPALAAVRCPAWLVSCSPDADRAAALERTAALLRQPRVQRWEGALHDVPLQWPALVAGLVRRASTRSRCAPPGKGLRHEPVARPATGGPAAAATSGAGRAFEGWNDAGDAASARSSTSRASGTPSRSPPSTPTSTTTSR